MNSASPPEVTRAPGAMVGRRHRYLQQRRFALLAASPAFMVLALLSIPPTVGALVLSLRNMSLERPTSHWVGFANFVRMWGDRRLWNALEITLLWELITVAGTMLVAVLAGIALYERVRGRARDALSVAFLLPILLPRISAGLIWRFMYSPLMGIMNYPMSLLGMRPVAFLSEPHVALYAVAAVDVWQWGLFFAVIVLKSLQTLPRSPIEAAYLDHASVWQIHWFISLPALRGTIITMLFVKGVESLRSFDLIYTMTAGGPGVATETLDLYAYQVGIGISGRLSYAAAMSVLLTIVTTIIFSIVWKRTRRWS
ncbi:carbohydrate ABC transporter permease [Lichenicoccus sp.]|uniref:carbohydrate ABC transporter permease n=1 Tax=Lichenicoccus sp. TaxID=2781899 RepID=UPI003D0BC694